MLQQAYFLPLFPMYGLPLVHSSLTVLARLLIYLLAMLFSVPLLFSGWVARCLAWARVCLKSVAVADVAKNENLHNGVTGTMAVFIIPVNLF